MAIAFEDFADMYYVLSHKCSYMYMANYIPWEVKSYIVKHKVGTVFLLTDNKQNRNEKRKIATNV